MHDEILGNPQAVLGKLLKRSADGIVHNDYHPDADAIGPLLFRRACLMGLQGIRVEASGQHLAGPSGTGKVKNPQSRQ